MTARPARSVRVVQLISFADALERYGPLPPRIVCDECGARPGQSHGPGCSYQGWPTAFSDPAAVEYRVTLAEALGNVKRLDVCVSCGVHGLNKQIVHRPWCSVVALPTVACFAPWRSGLVDETAELPF